MWKAGFEPTSPTSPKTDDDDDWDTNPDFVNDVDEKNQRWGNQKTIEIKDGTAKTDLDMNELRKEVKNKHDEKVKEEWSKQKGQSVRESYGVGKTGKV
ncbi:hypothetical protein HDU85_004291 [Gaertneriomyces sp. JEL0708]|nr:hypothetical protein HDU85_004291 [Gaertneriomyces sp. JEL0708]